MQIRNKEMSPAADLASDIPLVSLCFIGGHRLCVILAQLNPIWLEVDLKVQCVLEDNFQHIALDNSENRPCK